jgi:hypothetical protein
LSLSRSKEKLDVAHLDFFGIRVNPCLFVADIRAYPRKSAANYCGILKLDEV